MPNIPSRAQAESNALNIIQNNIVAELNLKMSSRQDITFLSPASVTKLKTAFKNWNVTTITQNQPVTTGDLTSVNFTAVTYLIVT